MAHAVAEQQFALPGLLVDRHSVVGQIDGGSLHAWPHDGAQWFWAG